MNFVAEVHSPQLTPPRACVSEVADAAGTMNPNQGGPPPSYGGQPAGAAMHFAPAQYMEIFDRLRADFENAMNENKSYRGLREEYQRKVEEHVRCSLIVVEPSPARLPLCAAGQDANLC